MTCSVCVALASVSTIDGGDSEANPQMNARCGACCSTIREPNEALNARSSGCAFGNAASCFRSAESPMIVNFLLALGIMRGLRRRSRRATLGQEIGVGRRFSERFSGSVSVSYEDGGSDSLVSPLAPTNGQTAISVGGQYKVTERIDISGGVRYTWLGNALPEVGTPDTPVGNFQDNNAVSVGLKVRVALN